MAKQYAFIKIRSNHTIVDQIIRILKRTFPDYDLEVIDVKKLLKKNAHIILINLIHMIVIYGIQTIFKSKSVIYNRFFGTPYIYQSIRRLLNIELSHDYVFTIQDCSLFNGKLTDVPHFVYTDHTVLANKNYPGYDEKEVLLSESWIKLESSIYSDADMVFTRSLIIRDSVINDYSCDPNKVQCIYYAPFMKGRKRVENEEKYKSKTILFIGLEWERKGGPLLLEAFERVLEKISDARLIIIGCNPIVRLRNVKVVGVIEKEKTHAYYEKSSVFCLPTRREPFGIVFLEAMSYCLPVIGTNTGAQPEFIIDGDNGYLIDIDDVNRLAQLLVYLLSNPTQCKLMGQRGYNIYCQNFTLDVVSSALRKYITLSISG